MRERERAQIVIKVQWWSKRAEVEPVVDAKFATDRARKTTGNAEDCRFGELIMS
jgi:hypothetical protein